MKSYRVIWDDDAKRSLRETFDYIKRGSPTAAKHVRKTLLKIAEGLQQMPERFSVEPSFNRNGFEYRSVSKWSYKIIYRIENEQVRILRVVHTSREVLIDGDID